MKPPGPRVLRRDLALILGIGHCPVNHPFFSFARRDDPVARVKRLVLEVHGSGRTAIRWMYRLWWPLRAVHLAVTRAGAVAGAEEAPGWGVSAGLLWWAMVRHNITPSAFLRMRLWRPEVRGRLGGYFQDYEFDVLLPWLSRGTNHEEVDSKQAIARLLQGHGVSTPPLALIVDEAGLSTPEGPVRPGDASALPATDLFVKWDALWGGEGAEVWLRDDASGTWSREGDVLDAGGLLSRLEERGRRHPLVVQELLRNGPGLEAFGETLCTFRIVTVRDGDAVGHLFSIFKMPAGGRWVDNFIAGGIAAGVDGDGHLRPGLGISTGHCFVDRHPDSGARIEGRGMPMWSELVALAIRAHTLVSDVPFVGWDVAWTGRGALILEGNMGWGAELPQMAFDEPLGEEFAALAWAAADRQRPDSG